MYRTLALAGVTAAVIVGAGTAALAESGSTSGSPAGPSSAAASTPSGSGAQAAATKGHGNRLGKRGVRATVVTRGKGNTFVTHDLIRGQVTAVSAASISIKAADGTTETFVVNAATKVKQRSAGQTGRASTSTISAVRSGDTVLVTGTGGPTPTAIPTAKHVVDVKK
jgi:hypothetical protein